MRPHRAWRETQGQMQQQSHQTPCLLYQPLILFHNSLASSHAHCKNNHSDSSFAGCSFNFILSNIKNVNSKIVYCASKSVYKYIGELK